jgi:hypothetical protein
VHHRFATVPCPTPHQGAGQERIAKAEKVPFGQRAGYCPFTGRGRRSLRAVDLPDEPLHLVQDRQARVDRRPKLLWWLLTLLVPLAGADSRTQITRKIDFNN